jgi:hypothetical protein
MQIAVSEMTGMSWEVLWAVSARFHVEDSCSVKRGCVGVGHPGRLAARV